VRSASYFGKGEENPSTIVRGKVIMGGTGISLKAEITARGVQGGIGFRPMEKWEKDRNKAEADIEKSDGSAYGGSLSEYCRGRG